MRGKSLGVPLRKAVATERFKGVGALQHRGSFPAHATRDEGIYVVERSVAFCMHPVATWGAQTLLAIRAVSRGSRAAFHAEKLNCGWVRNVSKSCIERLTSMLLPLFLHHRQTIRQLV
jgi:hypothetical protein